jgi:hypothetical protein
MKLLVNMNHSVVIDIKHLDIITEMLCVKREGYGKDATYLPTGEVPEIEMIADSQLITGKEQTEAELRRLLKRTEDEKSAQWLKMYNAEQETAKLKKEVETLRSVCPHQEEEKNEE